MEEISKQGVNSFKFFLAYKGALAITDEDLLHALQKCKDLGALPMVRCCQAHGEGCCSGSSSDIGMSRSIDFLLLALQMHAENIDGLVYAQQATVDRGITGPEGHYISRPSTFEVHSGASPAHQMPNRRVPMYFPDSTFSMSTSPASSMVVSLQKLRAQ